MNDKDITKLAAKLTILLATKDDVNGLKKELKTEIKALHEKADTILKFADYQAGKTFEYPFPIISSLGVLDFARTINIGSF